MELCKSPLESDRPLIVYIDFKSPYAWLALQPTLDLAKELGVTLDWRPFVLDIPSYLGSARLDKSGRVRQQQRSSEQWSGVKYAYYDCRRYANLRDITVRGTEKIWDTNLAAIGMLWAKQQGDAILEGYMKAVYEPFWKRELDVENPAVIRGVLRQVGAAVEGFDAYANGAGAEENAALQAAAFDAGIFGVPTYLVNGEMYFGREHLPRIRWHLEGEQGPAPDIAYESGNSVSSVPSQSLEVCVDFANPNSYLAVAPTLVLAAELGLTIVWHPVHTPPRKADTPVEDESRGARHLRFRAEYRAHDISRYASKELSANATSQDSRAACMAVLWLKRERAPQIDQFVEQVFDRIWMQGLEISNLAAIQALLVDIGVQADGFVEYANSAGNTALEEAQNTVAGRGVISTPTYLLGDEPFLGRQHLPLVRARLNS